MTLTFDVIHERQNQYQLVVRGEEHEFRQPCSENELRRLMIDLQTEFQE